MKALPKALAGAAVLAALGTPGSVLSQQPADCSAGPIPDRALELSFGAQKISVLPVINVRKISEVRSGDKVEEQYQLSVQDKDMFGDVEATITVAVPKGQRPDGKTFRRQPTGDVAQVLWGVKRREPSLSASFAGFAASARVEFGKRSGDVLPGRVYLCVPGGQTEKMFGTKLADPITLVGRFDAKLK